MFSVRTLETKRNYFEALRLFLAVLVLFSHCYPLSGGRARHDPLEAATFGRWTLGTLAVDAFLAISGFLVAASLERSTSIASFLLKRVRRVYPGFVVLMLLQAFLVAPRFASVYQPYTGSQIALEIANLVSYGFPYGGLLDPFASNSFPHELNGSLMDDSL